MAAQASVLENISKYLDFSLQPHVLNMKTFIRDTCDFFSKVEGLKMPACSIIISFDVVSLYTCIPYDDVRAVVQHYLEPDDRHLPPIHFLLSLVDILLQKNYFTFNDEFFLQTRRVSMGSSFAPRITNLFMARLEETFILNKEHNPYFNSIFLFLRYIDDYFCVFTDPQSMTF